MPLLHREARGERLRACYDAALRRRGYLEAEIEFVLARTSPSDLALIWAADTRVSRGSFPGWRPGGNRHFLQSLRMARELMGPRPSFTSCHGCGRMAFRDRSFDLTPASRTGSAPSAPTGGPLPGAVRVTGRGTVLFSSYSSASAGPAGVVRGQAKGLIGPIDFDATGTVYRVQGRFPVRHLGGASRAGGRLGLAP